MIYIELDSGYALLRSIEQTDLNEDIKKLVIEATGWWSPKNTCVELPSNFSIVVENYDGRVDSIDEVLQKYRTEWTITEGSKDLGFKVTLTPHQFEYAKNAVDVLENDYPSFYHDVVCNRIADVTDGVVDELLRYPVILKKLNELKHTGVTGKFTYFDIHLDDLYHILAEKFNCIFDPSKVDLLVNAVVQQLNEVLKKMIADDGIEIIEEKYRFVAR